ncbi:MAG: Calx-beta domain-containing protein [Sulfurimonadaceae bacterium]|jgi:hypothetical protein|nr:Calx-beta domain-containing protein [Sulfurimonadaceae bacterium]
MATIAGKVISIKNGSFKVTSQDGSTKTLSAGDTIYENDLVYGIGENKSQAKIEIELSNSDVIVLKKGQKQLIDASLLETADGEEELFFAVGDIELIMEAYRDIVDIVSDLRDHKWNNGDILEEETAEGEEDAEDTEQGGGAFDARTGDSVDTTSSVINKKINPYENPELPRTQTFDEGERNKGIIEHGNKELGKTPPNPFENPSRPSNPTNPNNPSNPNKPTDSDRPTSTPEPNEPVVTPPAPEPTKPNTPPAKLNIDDVTMYEQDGEMVFTIKLDRPAEGDIVINYTTRDKSATSGKDYVAKAGTITIPSGQSEVKIPVAILDDYLYENKEEFELVVTGTQGKVIVEKGTGVGTILDNPPATLKTPSSEDTPDGKDGSYDEGDSVYIKLLNSDCVKEGLDGAVDLANHTLTHQLQLVDKDGKAVEIPAGKSITVHLKYKSILGSVDDSDFKDGRTIEVTIDANTPKDADGIYTIDIDNQAIYDGAVESLEIYELSIEKITQNGNPFENITNHPTQNSVQGDIIDVNYTPETKTTKEDTPLDIPVTTTTPNGMFINNGDGDGFKKIEIGESADIFDNGIKIGEVTYSSGKFTFTPVEDYSNPNEVVSFMYYADTDDTTQEFKKITLKVTPVADAPKVEAKDVTAYEDNSNTQEGTSKIALGLKTPSLSKDQTDKNINGAGDHPERNGEITLKFTNGSSVNGAKLFKGSSEVATISSNNQEVKVVIVKSDGTVDYDYHHKDIVLGDTNIVYLTKTEYENLTIQHKEDNDTEIKINIKVTSYELDDNDKPLSGSDDYKNTIDANMSVKILPVTDPISIKWDSSSKGTISSDGKTYTFNSIDKAQNNTLDIKALVTSTSGAGADTKPDLDGSEHRTYIIEGLPKDTVVTIGGQSTTVGTNGKAEIVFSDANNKLLDPDFSIKLPQYYAGTLEGTITLKVQDKGVEESSDSTKWGELKTDSISFTITVNPKVLDAKTSSTISVTPNEGFEDAGRTSNKHNKTGADDFSSNGDIVDPTKGIRLKIDPSYDSNILTKGESVTINIDDLPKGSAVYVWDASKSGSDKYILVGVNTDGEAVGYKKVNGVYVEDGAISSDKISITTSGDTYKLTIKDYNIGKSANKYPIFIPPHNDDKDYGLKISGSIVDTRGDTPAETKYNGGNEFTLSVKVKNVADEPMGTELNTSTLENLTNYVEAEEDKVFELKSIYKNLENLGSYDSDGSEVLTIKIELPSGVSLLVEDGANYKITGSTYVATADQIKSGAIKIKFDEHFSGKVDGIKLTYITTETSGEKDSKTHFTQTVNLFVKPTIDSTINETTSHSEDTGTGVETVDAKSYYKLNLDINQNGDSDEELVSLYVKSGDYTLYIKNSGSFEEITYDADGKFDAKGKDIYLGLPEHESKSVDVGIEYTIKDSKNSGTDIDYETTETKEGIHSVIVNPVTDQPTVMLDTIIENVEGFEVSGSTLKVTNGTEGSFEVPLKVSSPDEDGSEAIAKIVITGVPEGVSVDGLSRDYEVAQSNGVITITALDGFSLNAEDFANIKFKVTSDANFESRDIHITTYTQDGSASEKSDTKAITLEKVYGDDDTGKPDPATMSLGAKGYSGTEDKEFTLWDVFEVSRTGGKDNDIARKSFTFEVPNGSKLEGFESSSSNTYTVELKGNKADWESQLANIKIIPEENLNDNTLDSSDKFKITATPQGESATVNNVSLKPVTDDMSIELTLGSSAIDEDGYTTLSIKLENSADKGFTNIDSIAIRVYEDYKDSDALGSGSSLVFSSFGDYTIADEGYGIYTIKKISGEFKLDANGELSLPELKYTSAQNRDGEVSFVVEVKHTEKDASNQKTSSDSISLAINPVIDYDEVVAATHTPADEDAEVTVGSSKISNYMKFEFTNATASDFSDNSESFTNLIIDKVPVGMIVWYKDGDTLKMASNVGTSTGSYVLNPKGDNQNVGVNQWFIPTNAKQTLPEVYIQAPEHWSGTISATAFLSIQEQNGGESVAQNIALDGTINPVADGVSIAPSNTAEQNYGGVDWAKLNLNFSDMKDTDGSETITLEFSGLTEDARFKIGEDELTSSGDKKATWNSSKWSISGITYDDIKADNLHMMDTKGATITVKAWSVDGNDESSRTDDKTFNLSYKTEGSFSSDIFTLSKGDIDYSGLQKYIDPNKVKTIDLNITSANKLTLTLEDVLEMTGSDNELIIKGDSQDKVSLTNNGWTLSEDEGKNGSVVDDYKVYEYSKDSDTLTLKVEQNIEHSF